MGSLIFDAKQLNRGIKYSQKEEFTVMSSFVTFCSKVITPRLCVTYNISIFLFIIYKSNIKRHKCIFKAPLAIQIRKKVKKTNKTKVKQRGT